MKEHDYRPYLCNERYPGERHLDYFKCYNCGDIVFQDSRNKMNRPSQHSPYYRTKYDANNLSCSELIMANVLE